MVIIVSLPPFFPPSLSSPHPSPYFLSLHLVLGMDFRGYEFQVR